MKKLDILESLMLVLEKPGSANHAGVLQVFQLPARGGKAYLERIHRALLSAEPAAPFNCIPAFTPGKGPHWQQVTAFVASYHVLRLALPAPGSDEQLMEMVSGLYPGLLDRKLPLWRSYMIEGLSGNRVALFTKVHHSYADGISGARMIFGSLNDRPRAATIVPLWASAPDEKLSPPPARDRPDRHLDPDGLATRAQHNISALRDLGGELLRIGARTLGRVDDGPATPLSAQKTPLDKSFTSGARSFACGSFPLEEMRAIGRRQGATINDVVMTVCDHAMQRYLREKDAPAQDRLTSLMAVSTRGPGDGQKANAATLVLARLGEADADIVSRLQQVTRETGLLKKLVRSRSGLSMFYSSLLLFGAQLARQLPWLGEQLPPNCNLAVSNVPAAGDKTFYLGSARMTSLYTAPIVPEGVPVNVTLAPYAGQLFFGVGAASEVMPDTPRYATLIEQAYAELAKTVPLANPENSRAGMNKG